MPFRIAREKLAWTFTVDDEALGNAVVRLLSHAHGRAFGVTALAVALQKALPGKLRRIGVILSGDNIDPAMLTSLINRYPAAI